MFLSDFILVFLPHLSQKPGVSRTTLKIFFRFIERVSHKDIYICKQVFKKNYFTVVVNVIFRMTFSCHLKSNQDVMFGTNPESVFHGLNLLSPEI